MKILPSESVIEVIEYITAKYPEWDMAEMGTAIIIMYLFALQLAGKEDPKIALDKIVESLIKSYHMTVTLANIKQNGETH